MIGLAVRAASFFQLAISGLVLMLLDLAKPSELPAGQVPASRQRTMVSLAL
jgi:hypothetical protein